MKATGIYTAGILVMTSQLTREYIYMPQFCRCICFSLNHDLKWYISTQKKGKKMQPCFSFILFVGKSMYKSTLYVTVRADLPSGHFLC